MLDPLRVATLLDAWALPPEHPIMRFLTGSSEVLPLSPDERQAGLCEEIRKARTLIHEKIDILEAAVSDLKEEIEDLGG